MLNSYFTDHATTRPATSASVKRGIDIVVSVLLIAVTLPLLVTACLLIITESFGSPFYLQWRAGYMNRAFRIIKLRTMIIDADRIGPLLTQEGDPRVTRIGAFLRRWSIDELPQLLNVLMGHMSLVGPRPELIPIVETYTAHQRTVLLVRPGLTGWSQVNGRDDLPIPQKLELEVEYVANRTLARDLSIIARTPKAVLSGRGMRK